MTLISFTNPEGLSYTTESFEKVSINEDMDVKVREFSISLVVFDESIIKQMGVGTEVEITYDEGSVFRGIVDNNPKSLDRFKKSYEITGKDKLSRSQQIIVNESYEDVIISDIVLDLLTKYPVEDMTIGMISSAPYRTSVKFKNTYLYTALERLAEAVNFTFRMNLDGTFDFFEKNAYQSNLTIKTGMFFAGSASFQTDSSSLINRLWAFGGSSLSPDITQTIIGDGANSTYLLNYKPRISTTGRIEMSLNGVALSAGIKGINDQDAVDALIDYNEKTISFMNPDTKEARILTTGENPIITYRVESPIMAIVEEPESIGKYGKREGIESFPDITEKVALIDRAKEYLAKYSKPITSGSIRSWLNDWNVSEIVKIEIEVEEGLFLDEWLQITSKTIDLSPNKMEVSYEFEQKKGLSNLLKDIIERLDQLEKDSQDEIVEQISSIREVLRAGDDIIIRKRVSPEFIIGKSALGAAI